MIKNCYKKSIILLRVQNKSSKRRRTQKKIVFLKEYVENADLHKSVMKKIMTTHK